MFGLPAVAVVGMIIGTVWFFRDHPVNKHRFSWQQLIANNFYISYIDGLGKAWIVEIDYNATVKSPACKHLGKRKARFLIPAGYRKSQFIDFLDSVPDMGIEVHKVIKGITHEDFLHELNFSKEDLMIYRDFKRNLLLRALKG